MSTGSAGDQDGQAGAVDVVELAQGQGVRTGADLDGEARAAVGLDEPVLVAGEGAGIGGVLQCIAADLGEPLCQFSRAGNLDAAVLPVDHLPLAVPGDDEGGIDALGVVVERLGFDLAQGEAPHEVPGAGTGVALGEFDLPRHEPPRRVLQVQVDPQKVRLPPLGEGDVWIIPRQLPRLLLFLRRGGSRHQGDPVGVDHGHEKNGGGIGQFRCVHAADGAPGAQRLGVILGEFQQNRGSEPFVGVVGGGVEHPPRPRADGQGADGSAIGGGDQGLGAKRRIFRRQPIHQGIGKLRGHGNICWDNGHKITS